MSKLTEQQQYLLSRISTYYLTGKPKSTEPLKVRQARRIVKRYDDIIERKNKDFKQALNKARSLVIETIYFATPEKSLQVVKAFEAKYKKN